MVRVAGLMGQEAAGLAVRSADGLTPSQALAALKARVTELTSRQAKLWKRELRPALAAEGIEIVTIEECSPKELKRLETVFTRDIYPVLTPLAVGAGQPFPYISGLSLSLGVLAVDPDSAEERFARVKVPEGLDRFVDAGRAARSARVGDRALPAVALPRDGDLRARALPRHPRRRLRGVGRRRRPARGRRVGAPPPPLRRRRARRGVGLGVGGMLDRLREGLDVRDDQIYEIEGLLDLADLMQLTRPRPARSEARAVGADHAAAPRAREGRRSPVRRDPPRRPARPPAVRVLPDELRGLRRGRGRRPRRDRDEDGRVSHLRRQHARLGADRLRRGREAGGLPRRAEGPLRRAAQHRVVARAGAGGRARRPRLPGHEDPRQDDARRPPRGGRAAALRPHRHRQLPRRRPRASTRTSASSPPTRRSRPTSPTSSTT